MKIGDTPGKDEDENGIPVSNSFLRLTWLSAKETQSINFADLVLNAPYRDPLRKGAATTVKSRIEAWKQISLITMIPETVPRLGFEDRSFFYFSDGRRNDFLHGIAVAKATGMIVRW